MKTTQCFDFVSTPTNSRVVLAGRGPGATGPSYRPQLIRAAAVCSRGSSAKRRNLGKPSALGWEETDVRAAGDGVTGRRVETIVRFRMPARHGRVRGLAGTRAGFSCAGV